MNKWILASNDDTEAASTLALKAALQSDFRRLLLKYCPLARELQFASSLPATEAQVVEDIRYSVTSAEISAVYRADSHHVNGEPPELEWRKWPTSTTHQLCQDNEVDMFSFPVLFLQGGGYDKSSGLTRQQHARYILYQATPRFTRCHRAYEEYILQTFNTVERYAQIVTQLQL